MLTPIESMTPEDVLLHVVVNVLVTPLAGGLVSS